MTYRSIEYPASFAALRGDSEDYGGQMAEMALESWFADTPELIWRTGRPVSDRMWSLARPVTTRPSRSPRQEGLRIAQILMQGKVDAGLTARRLRFIGSTASFQAPLHLLA